MRVVVRKTEVCSVLPAISYELVASRLKKHPFDVSVVFCTRQVGMAYLQWILPEGSWTPLSAAVEPISSQVRKAYQICQDVVNAAFGPNKVLAEAVLTVPSEDFVFFRQKIGGDFEMAFTVWGYKYPRKYDSVVITGPYTPSMVMQEVKLRFIYDGRPIGNTAFTINGQPRCTSENGLFELGSHPVGTSFPVGMEDDDSMTLTVEKGRNLYDFDLTKYVIVEIVTRSGGEAVAGVEGTISFNGRTVNVTTGNDGCAQVELPYWKQLSECTAIVGNEKEIKKALLPKTIFHFELPFSQDFVCIDSETRQPIPGVKNLVTITHQDGIKEEMTLTCNTKGRFTLSAKEKSVVEVVSTKFPDYESRTTPKSPFKSIGKTIVMKPEMETLMFRTINAKTSGLLPDCDIQVLGSVSGGMKPASSGNGEFDVTFRRGEKLTITASKKCYRALDFIKEKVWADLQVAQDRRDIRLTLGAVSYENSDHPKYGKKTYLLMEPNRRFRFEWRLCSVCTMLTVTDANGIIIGRFGIDSPKGDGIGKQYTPPTGSTYLECPTDTVCVIIQSVNTDTAYFKIYCN